MIDIKWAELHTTLFLAGTNLQAKLDPSKRRDGNLSMKYCRKHRELHVTFKGETAIIPSTNVASMIEGTVPALPSAVKSVFHGKIEAQVETPMSHVFAGEGQGKTGRG